MKGIFLVLGLIIYLYLSYAHFYNQIKDQNLIPPSQTIFHLGSGSKNLTYITLGDSLTAGTGASASFNTYPYLLSQNLASEGYSVKLINLAIPGAGIDDVVSSELPKIQGLKPDLITVLIGVNDIHNFKSVTSFKDSYFKSAMVLKESGTKVVLINIPYLGYQTSLLPPYNILLDLRTKQFNSVILDVAVQNHFGYIDLYQSSRKNFDNKNLYSSDLFHPSDLGYKIIANFIDANWNIRP